MHADDVGTVVDLVEAARAGDRLAFAALFDRFHPVVYRTLRARVSAPEDVEDMVAETFLETWKGLGRYEWTGAPFRAWLLRIALARVSNHYRRAAARPDTTAAGDELDRILEAGDEHAHTEQRIEVMRLLETLPDEHRTVLTLRFYGGLSAEEIGAMLGKRAGTVRQIQMTALERLGRHARREQAA